MGATATLATRAASVQPGGETTCEIRIRNSGQVVDQFTLEVLGDAASWAILEPSTVSLFPGAEAVARIRFKPPKVPSIPARAIPFAVRVRSREDAQASTVEEGVVEVGPFNDTFAELIPRTARGSFRARSQLAVDNRGNVRVNARLTASDPDRRLNFAILPPGIVADPGTASFARVRLSPRERFFTGPPKALPYKVFVHQDGLPPLAVDGSMMQEGLLPGWLLPAVIAAVVLGIVLLAVWFTLLKPSIQSAATAAVQPQAQAASVAASRAAAAVSAVAPATKPATGGGVNPFGGDLKNGRITVVGSQGPAYSAGGGMSITDLVFENPNADSGTIRLQRLDVNNNAADLLVLRLENFRDLDFHFVTPIVIPSGEQLRLFSDNCTPGAGTTCAASVYFSGYQKS